MKKCNTKLLSIPVSQVEPDPVGEMPANCGSLKPYIDHYCALITGGDPEKTLEVIADPPPGAASIFDYGSLFSGAASGGSRHGEWVLLTEFKSRRLSEIPPSSTLVQPGSWAARSLNRAKRGRRKGCR